MLTCQLEELPIGGVVWTFVVCGFLVAACILVAIFINLNKKK